MGEWKELLKAMLDVRNDLSKADKEEIWKYYQPEDAVKWEDLLSFQDKIRFKLSEEYITFLLYANGWKCFYKMIDLFGTNDYEAETIERARKLLDAELENNEALKEIGEYLLPVAVSRTEKDLFVMVLAKNDEYGQVIWLSDGEIERFESFTEFFKAMIEYNKKELEKMICE